MTANQEDWENGRSLDISSSSDPSAHESSRTHRQASRFLGIQFACCRVYTRIYVNRSGTAYEGCCPRCGRPLRIPIGDGGVDSRFFTAY